MSILYEVGQIDRDLFAGHGKPGRETGTKPGTTLATANFGVITQASIALRLIQFGLKYLF